MRNKNQNGFTLIEVLVALSLLLIVILGIEKTMIRTKRMQQEAWFRTTAINQIKNMQALMEISKIGGEQFFQTWQQDNRTLLPQGSGKIDNKHITVIWRDVGIPIWHCEKPKQAGRNCLMSS